MIQRSRAEKIRELKKLKQELNSRTSYAKNRRYIKRIRIKKLEKELKISDKVLAKNLKPTKVILFVSDLYER